MQAEHGLTPLFRILCFSYASLDNRFHYTTIVQEMSVFSLKLFVVLTFFFEKMQRLCVSFH
jgi:hypothetical protein